MVRFFSLTSGVLASAFIFGPFFLRFLGLDRAAVSDGLVGTFGRKYGVSIWWFSRVFFN